MKQLSPQDFVELTGPDLKIDLAYAKPDNLLFGEQIYRADTRLWAHKNLARIVFKAAKTLQQQYGLTLIVYDCLRTVDAQEKMLQTRRVKGNPHWLEEPRLLSTPGNGAHPRGMAVDVGLEDKDGKLLDMGTPFDYLASDASPDQNPAHRQHPHLSEEVKRNRKILDDAMFGAAKECGFELVGLPQEWWDYRFRDIVYNQYAPLSDNDLPPEMRQL